MKVIACGVVGLVLLAGCTTPAPSPTPISSPIPTSALATARPGADLVCGIDRAAIEMVTGFKVARSDGALTVQDGVGAGTCSVWTDNKHVGGELLVVRLFPTSSAKGIEWRDRVDGKRETPPTLVYPRDVVDGAYWKGTLDGDSVVFWGATVIVVSAGPLILGRTWSDDLLAMNQQVAATYGLVGSGGKS